MSRLESIVFSSVMFEFAEEMMEVVERLVDGKFVGADEFDDFTGVVTGEAFFEIIDAVVFA